jgi:sulfite reductase (ferredoxin)
MSDVESIKLHSSHLRGAIAAELAAPSSGLSDESATLLKFHGSYQQEDRDKRKARKATGQEKTHEFMVRSRIPGGALTAAQYLAHDGLAERFGNATLRLTTRQGIQLHGVLKRNLRATIREINRVLLSTLAACGDVNRNVMACPAPARSHAHADVLVAAQRLAAHLAPRSRAYHEIWLDGEKLDAAEGSADPEPIYGPTYLPRKFKIAVAYPGDNCVDAFTQDIAFVAELDEARGVTGYTVLIGGGMGSTHGKSQTYPRLATPLCFVEPAGLLDVAEAIVTVQRDFGDRTNRRHARMKYLVEERGVGWFEGEVTRRLGRPLEAPHPIAFDAALDHLGWQRQCDGDWSLGIYVENGRVADRTSGLLRSGIRAVCERYGFDLRLTGQQNLIFAGVPQSKRADVERTLRGYGIETDPVALGLRRDAMACPALPTCGLAVAEAERALPDVVAAIETIVAEIGMAGERISIRMTGCPNGCARPRMGDIGIVGRSLGVYDLYLGGDPGGTRLNAPFAQGVARAAIPEKLRLPLERWARERHAGEALGDYVARTGLGLGDGGGDPAGAPLGEAAGVGVAVGAGDGVAGGGSVGWPAGRTLGTSRT